MLDERCLLDAGMSEKQACAVVAYMENGNAKQAEAMLKAWRVELLNRLHGCQK